MRKRIIAVLLTGVLAAAVLTSCGEKRSDNLFDKDAGAEDTSKETPIEDFVWESTDEGITIIQYKGNAKEVIVPSVIEGKMVNCVSSAAFSGNITVESIVMSEYISDSSIITFKNCPSLTYLEFPGIYDYYINFVECESLQVLSFPNSKGIRIYQKNTKYKLPNLEKLIIPSAEYIRFTLSGYVDELSLSEITVSEELLNNSYVTYSRDLCFIVLDPSQFNFDDKTYTTPAHTTPNDILKLFLRTSLTINGKLYTAS